MVEPIEQPRLSRSERKERTRRALLDASLELMEDRGFSGLSLREVARAAGIVPTAFYRHYASLEDLGAALAEDAMRMLRRTLREARRHGDGLTIAGAVDALDRAAAEHPGQFRFVLRERHGGTAEVRRTIETELRLLAGELAIDLARMPELAQWDTDDLEAASGLLVAAALDAVPALIADTGRGDSAVADARGEALTLLARRLRMIGLGIRAWRPAG